MTRQSTLRTIHNSERFGHSLLSSAQIGQNSSVLIDANVLEELPDGIVYAQIDACGVGISELLTASFKLHKPVVETGGELSTDPWEIILAEISFVFDAPMVVARVKSNDTYFVRTNVRDIECLHLLGEMPRSVNFKLPSNSNPLIPLMVRRQLTAFYREHANHHFNDVKSSLACLYYPTDDTFVRPFENARTNYESLLLAVGDTEESNEQTKHELYAEAEIQNPMLLDIRGVAVIALYYVPHENNQSVAEVLPQFIGTIEVFLPSLDTLSEQLSSGQVNKCYLDADHFARLSVRLKDAISRTAIEDFVNNTSNSTQPLISMPRFSEHRTDLKRWIDDIVRSNTLSSVAVESALPEVFDDLYLQIKRFLPRYGFKATDVGVAFIVCDPPGIQESIAHYLFPPVFIKEVLKSTPDEGKAIRDALLILSGCDPDNKPSNSRSALGRSLKTGIPLDRGLLGYIRETFFPAMVKDLKQDLRIRSYSDGDLEQYEKILFPQLNNLRLVVEFPLVLFSGSDGLGRSHVIPTSLIIFLSGEIQKDVPAHCIHFLYALAYHSRYILARAFEAEVQRESQVDRVGIVVHDVDRMNRLFTECIVRMAQITDEVGRGSARYTISHRKELADYTTSARTIKEYLQFSQWIANKRNKDMDVMGNDIVSEQITAFQTMFSSVQRSTKAWPGWTASNKVQLDQDEFLYYGKQESQCKFQWPQGALIAILWNLSANAEAIYRSIDPTVRQKILLGKRPKITCQIGGIDPTLKTVFAVFEVTFPGIEFSLGEREPLISSSNFANSCVRPHRSSCDHCSAQRRCLPFRNAKVILSEKSTGDGRGMRSCWQAIREWYKLMNIQMQTDDVFKPIKAGSPEKIEFTVPMTWIGYSRD